MSNEEVNLPKQHKPIQLQDTKNTTKIFLDLLKKFYQVIIKMNK